MTPETRRSMLQKYNLPEGSSILAGSALLCLTIDQITKMAARAHMQSLEFGQAPFGTVFLSLKEAWNPGLNFGILQEHSEMLRWPLVAAALLIAALACHIALFNRTNTFIKVFAGIFTGGAIGNTVDRIEFAMVYDFLNATCCGNSNPYSFNLADVFIFIGLFGLLFLPPDPE